MSGSQKTVFRRHVAVHRTGPKAPLGDGTPSRDLLQTVHQGSSTRGNGTTSTTSPYCRFHRFRNQSQRMYTSTAVGIHYAIRYSMLQLSHWFFYQPDDPKSILAPLREFGVTQLYTDAADSIKELKKINASLLVNFLDLLDILIKCRASPIRIKKLEDIELLFCNFHHLINKFRPHQALETLIQMIKIQKDQKLKLVEQTNR